jgi:hypothetical protein
VTMMVDADLEAARPLAGGKARKVA